VLRHELMDGDSRVKIPCRVIFVFSTADQKVARKTREKAVTRIQQGLEKLARSVAEGRRYTDPASVARRVNKLFGNRAAAAYFSYEMVPLSAQQRAALPAPARGCKVAQYRLEFSYDAQAAKRDEIYDGISVLVTTVPPRQDSADLLFTKFKQQNHNELANHQ
jgi:hypothetical protein